MLLTQGKQRERQSQLGLHKSFWVTVLLQLPHQLLSLQRPFSLSARQTEKMGRVPKYSSQYMSPYSCEVFPGPPAHDGLSLQPGELLGVPLRMLCLLQGCLSFCIAGAATKTRIGSSGSQQQAAVDGRSLSWPELWNGLGIWGGGRCTQGSAALPQGTGGATLPWQLLTAVGYVT